MSMSNVASDDDVVEIFVEEAGEVFDRLDMHLPLLRKRPADKSALTEIRRGFHTLKGSGRMVNALDLAAVAWKVEDMLNRVIDGSAQVTEPMVELVSTARNLMPRMLNAFKSHRSMEDDNEVETLMMRADDLAEGKAPVSARPQPPIAAVKSSGDQDLVLKLAGVSRRLNRLQQSSNEALHRSEMALQLARRGATHIQSIRASTRDHVDRNEVSRVIEQVNRLTKEVQDLRGQAEHIHPQQSAHPYEISQLINQRVRERMSLIERQRNELQRELGEARRAAASSRGLAWGALILSALAGGGIVAALLMSGPFLG